MSKNIVFIVNITDPDKASRSTPYHLSINSWKAWCDKNYCDLFILDQRIYPKEIMNANWHKIFVLDLLAANDIDYNQVMIVDADTIIHPEAPNVFELTGNKMSVVRNYGSMDWVCRSYENYKKHLFPETEYSPIDYFNSGMIIINHIHKSFYDIVQKFYLTNYQNIQLIQKTYGVGTDQPVLNFLTRQENIELNFLPYEWNMQDMTRFEILNQNLTFTKTGWLYHFCAIPGGDVSTDQWMQLTYNTLYHDK
jgi:hypothetical protein